MDALLQAHPVETEDRIAHARRLARVGELTDLVLIEDCLLAGVADEESAEQGGDPWRNWLVTAWNRAVRAWGDANRGTIIDCNPTWDGRSTWASMAAWHKKARAYETPEERLANYSESLARNWRTWTIRPLEEVVADILARGLVATEEEALSLAVVAIDTLESRNNGRAV